MTALKPNVELETSQNVWDNQQMHANATLLDKIAWMITRKERPPKGMYYPLPPRK